MTKISVTKPINNQNHVQNRYEVDPIFFTFPTRQKKFTFVNGTASERTILAGTLVGITTADPTIAKPTVATATDGSEIAMAVVLYDIVIAAGAAEEVDALVGENGAIWDDKVVLEGVAETLDTIVTTTGQTIRYTLLNANANLKLEAAARNMSDYRNEQV
jgi:hypothetical protein